MAPTNPADFPRLLEAHLQPLHVPFSRAGVVGFAACTAAAFLTLAVLEVARHVHYRRHRGSGFVPGTQHWCMAAAFIAGAFELVALVFLALSLL